jgi:hydroxymethylbilane synthase
VETSLHFNIGTRGSDLAMWQAHHVRDLLEARGATVDIVVMKTRGDRIQNVSFDKMEGKGFFTKEIEAALLEGDIDLAVHSHKDLETEPPQGLVVAAVPTRGPVEDLLIVRKDHVDLTAPLHVRSGALVGTSSMRRKKQLEFWQPDLVVEPLRGNVPTRIRKLREGKYDAIMLAYAGVHRLDLDLSDLHLHVLDPLMFVPAPAQGALALQMREHDERLAFVRQLTDPRTVQAIELERSILRELEGGCQLPFGAHVPRPEDHAMEQGLEVHAYLGSRSGPIRKSWSNPSTSWVESKVFLSQLLEPATWPTTFITQDLSPGNPLQAMFLARHSVLHGASCISVQTASAQPPEDPKEGDWLFVGSPKCAELLAATHDLSRFHIAAMGEGTRQALPAGTHIAWSGNGRPVEVFQELSTLVGEAAVWIPHANRTMRRWEGTLKHPKPWHFYEVVVQPVSLPSHQLALILSPSNADGYVQSGGQAPVIAIGETTAEHCRMLGLSVVGTAHSPQAWGWSVAIDAFTSSQR